MLQELIAFIEPDLRPVSGAVFYTGRSAFSKKSEFYLLGLNPGGQLKDHASHSIECNITRFAEGPAAWSAYCCDEWRNATAGNHPMQKRVRHLLTNLDLDPRCVPASNVIVTRTAREADLSNKRTLMERDWKFHEAAIRLLDSQVILCMGSTAGLFVRRKLRADLFVDKFTETNNRGWTNEAHRNEAGQLVLTLTHPSVADWCSEAADPSGLILRALRTKQDGVASV